MLLFDGESGLRSRKTQKIIADNFNIKIHAEPFFKRNMAERAIREIKLRMAIYLDLEQKPLTKWRDNLDTIVNIINQNKPQYKSVMQMLKAFFTESPTTVLPQSLNHLYKFNVGDSVRINASPTQRRDLGFKYSLNIGKVITNPKIFLLYYKLILLCVGKLQKNMKAVINSRRLITKNKTIIPIYTVLIPTLNQVD